MPPSHRSQFNRPTRKVPPATDADRAAEEAEYKFRLFIQGKTTRALCVYSSLHRICRRHLGTNYCIEIADVKGQPGWADIGAVIVVPVEVARNSAAFRQVLADLAKEEELAIREKETVPVWKSRRRTTF